MFDKDLISGFNHRQANWEFSTSVQHEVLPGIALDVGYFRRAWAHFRVTDNILVGPDDFTRFDIVAPTDARLPGGGGYPVRGFYDVVPGKFGQVRNLNALSDDYGNQFENWNGVDITVNSRLKNGVTLQAGMSTGKTMEDNCEIVDAAARDEQLPGRRRRRCRRRGAPAEWCHRESPFLTQFKAYGVYIVPKIEVQVAGSFRSLPGQIGPPALPPNNDVQVALAATNAFLATNSTLGRPLAGGAANVSPAVARAVHGVSRSPQRARPAVRQDHPLLRAAGGGERGRLQRAQLERADHGEPVVRGLPAADRDPQRAAGEVQHQLRLLNPRLA